MRELTRIVPYGERRAHGFVALSFFLLARYIGFEAGRALLTGHEAETTVLGICLSMATLCICPWLGRAKLRLGEQLGSAATAGEGRQNLICAYLALAVLAGLLANTLFGIWWLDPTVALGIAMLATSKDDAHGVAMRAVVRPVSRRQRPRARPRTVAHRSHQWSARAAAATHDHHRSRA